MDYSTIKNKLKSYRTFGEMQADVNLMFRNATTFNPHGSAVHTKALELLAKSNDKFAEARSAWLDEIGDADATVPAIAQTASIAPAASAADTIAVKAQEAVEVVVRVKRDPPPPPVPIVLPPRRYCSVTRAVLLNHLSSCQFVDVFFFNSTLRI